MLLALMVASVKRRQAGKSGLYSIVWREVKFRGSALFSTPPPPKQRVHRSIESLFYTTNMPRNKISDDLDHVKKDPKLVR